ncbi:hypothetical protein HGRIS_007555 [Hohenbuehelia grisea]|uniref:Uncharacterized protein n=1 Tax=Hohenbuehelia grisea TaxID=104357 RepID=A0ABR3J577_9AGAR
MPIYIRTPFSDVHHKIISSSGRIIGSSIIHPSAIVDFLRTSFLHATQRTKSLIRRLSSQAKLLFSKQPQTASPWPIHTGPFIHYPEQWLSLKHIERKAATSEETGARAIAWLLGSTSHPPTTSEALQSLGAFPVRTHKTITDLLPSRTPQSIRVSMHRIEYSDASQELLPKARCLERFSRSLYSLYPGQCGRHVLPEALWDAYIHTSFCPTSLPVKRSASHG